MDHCQYHGRYSKGGLIALALLCFMIQSRGQTIIELGGMTFAYELEDDLIHIELTAPTQGWVGVGFNHENSIVGSDLLLFRVKNGKSEGLDMKVKGIGDPVEDKNLGDQVSFLDLAGAETNSKTTVRFSRSLVTGERSDFALQEGASFWLILAYSMHDDFGHHSRMRRHVRIKL